MPTASRLTPDRWRQIEDVFHKAATYTTAERPSFLERVCGTDLKLRREAESLLAGLDESTPFLEATVQDAAEA